MSFQTDAGAIAIASVTASLGTYGVIKQFDINQGMLVLAQNADARAAEYLAITQAAYNNITLPIFNADYTLFNRFLTSFANYQALYETEAFRLITYTADYVMQEGRSLAAVQRQFDKAALQRKRQNGKYNTGRARYESVWFATVTALAKVDMVNHSYRFEEARKRYYDTWYWSRQTAGAHVVQQMEADAISALNHAGAVVAQGLSSIGGAEKALLSAAENHENVMQARSNIWGGIANGSFEKAGYSMGMHAARENSIYGGSNEPLNNDPIVGIGSFGFGTLLPNT